MKKLCIFGGSFDPPHVGHEMIIKELLSQDFDLILVMPTKDVEYKKISTRKEDRMKMLELFCLEFKGQVLISDLEFKIKGVTKTCDTLRVIKKIYPDYDIYFALGSDSITSLPTWNEYEYLRDNLKFVIAKRDQYLIPSGINYIELDNEIVDVSSTELRTSLNKNYINDDVYDYIVKNKLYKTSPEPSAAHQHHGHHHHHHGDDVSGNLLLVFFLNLLFVFIEIIGAYFTNSIAIFSDAIHDLGDCITILLAYVLEKISNKGSDAKYTYGYKRLSLVGAFITSVILVSGSLFVLKTATTRFFEPQEVNGMVMLYLAVIGIAINGFGAYKIAKKTKFMSRAIMLHLLEDVLGWVAVLISSIFIITLNWYFLDPLLSILIAVFILYNAIKNIVGIFSVLLEKVPSHIDYPKVIEVLNGYDFARDVHDVHIWSLDGETTIFTCHIVIDDEITQREIDEFNQVIKRDLKELGITHATVQFETATYHQDDEVLCN